MGNLTTDAVIIRFGCDLFRRTTTDKSATAQTHKANKASDDAGRYVKTLFNSAALKPFESIVSAARSVIEKETVPWDGSGMHLLAVSKFLEFDAQMWKLSAEFDKAREDFIANYQSHIDESKARLGNLFNPDNYASVDELRMDCAFRFNYLPVPSYEDIRVADTVMQERMVDAISSAYTGLVTSLADDLYDEVKAAHDQLDQGERFRSERVDRLIEKVKKIKSYNLTNDPRIDAALADVEKSVIGELNTYIATRNQRSTPKDEKEQARLEAKKRIHDAALRMAGMF